MITIRQASEADFPLIRGIAHQTWPHTFGSILSPEQIAYMLEWMYSLSALKNQAGEGHTFLLAQEDDNYLGYASYELNYNGAPKTRVHKIYVLPQAQGKGAGKALMEHITRMALANNNDILNLNVNRDNPAVAFYQSSGFTITATEKIPIGNGFFMDDYVMEKKL